MTGKGNKTAKSYLFWQKSSEKLKKQLIGLLAKTTRRLQTAGINLNQ